MIEITEGLSTYHDSRGSIKNLIVEPVGVAVISTLGGEVRGNHRHLSHGHWEYVVSGNIEVFHGQGDEREAIVLGKGQMVFTPPGCVHGFASLTNSTIIHILTMPYSPGFYEKDTERL